MAPRPRRAPSRSWLSPVFAGAGALLILFFAVPIAAMVAKEPPAVLWHTLLDPTVAAALWVSVSAAAAATAVALVFGVPLGYLLARRDFTGKAFVAALVDMPVVVPHLVAGIALLTVLKPDGIFGAPAAALGINFIDALPGTVAAMLFVSAPFVVNAARSAFEAVDPRLEAASRGLGASVGRTFFKVSLPLARGGIISGAVMAWARAVSEFGAVLIIAYYPRIGPTLIYERFTSFGLKSSRPVAVLLVLVCLTIFAILRFRRPRTAVSTKEGGGAAAR